MTQNYRQKALASSATLRVSECAYQEYFIYYYILYSADILNANSSFWGHKRPPIHFHYIKRKKTQTNFVQGYSTLRLGFSFVFIC